MKSRVIASPSEHPVFSDEPGPTKRFHVTLHTFFIICSTCVHSAPPSSAGGSNALTVYQIGDDVIAPTPAPTPEVEEPTPAPTPEAEEEDYGELGCAADFTEGVRVRGSDKGRCQLRGRKQYTGRVNRRHLWNDTEKTAQSIDGMNGMRDS